MRIGLVVAGVIVIIVGAVLLFVPVVPQASETVQSNSSAPYYLGSISGFSLTGSIPISVSWTSTSSVEVIAAAVSCSGSGCTNVSQISGTTAESGTSGSFTLNQPDGGSIIMGIASVTGGGTANATFKITTAITTVGSILVIVGILLLIVGLVLKSKRPAPIEAPAQAAEPMSTPPTPPPS